MTGICYFSDKSTDYFAEMQVKAIAKNEESIALKECGNFSPEKADKLLNEAIIKDCDKIVFLTEDANVDTLSRLIPQEYGQYFEDIQVIPENFYRIHENDAAAPAAPAQATQPTQQPQQQQNAKKQSAAQVVIICDAAIPTNNAVNAMAAELTAQTNLIKAGQYQQYGVPLNSIPVIQFCNVDSAGLCAGNIHSLYKKHPSLSKGYENLKVSSDGYESNVENLEACAATEEFVKAGGKRLYILPKGFNVQAQGQNIVFIQGSNNYSNSSLNQKALGMIQQLLKDTNNKISDVPTRSDYKEEDEKTQEEFSKDQKKVEYIATYMKAYEWWTKHKDKRQRTKDATSEFEKELLKWLGSDFVRAWDNAKNGKDGAAAAFLANGISKMYKAAKDNAKNSADNEDKKENATNDDEKTARKIFKHKSYRELCEVLGLKG